MYTSNFPEEALLEEVVRETGPQREIVLHNDDVNTFDHVIECLMKICDHDPIQAEQCAWIVHYNGKCSVKRGSFKDLEPRCVALLDRGLSAAIQ
jgi:ATP-dependent Clp protease adaptor protein ClpS